MIRHECGALADLGRSQALGGAGVGVGIRSDQVHVAANTSLGLQFDAAGADLAELETHPGLCRIARHHVLLLQFIGSGRHQQAFWRWLPAQPEFDLFAGGGFEAVAVVVRTALRLERLAEAGERREAAICQVDNAGAAGEGAVALAVPLRRAK